MMMSKETLLREARRLQYKPELYEKTLQLLTVLKNISELPYLKERFVLKGGTALNLFHCDQPPRLSVDIDLNYIGQVDRSKMLKEKPNILASLNSICQ
jgi:predicted nucleotidyltransferase component of viral defense system